jgi:hypothetical protein
MTETPAIEPRRKGRSGTQAMLIPSLGMVEASIAAVPAGEISDLATIRKALAREFGADACCPVTVQRHLRDIAQRAVSAFETGKSGDSLLPFWRVADPDRSGVKGLAGGAAFIRARRRAER